MCGGGDAAGACFSEPQCLHCGEVTEGKPDPGTQALEPRLPAGLGSSAALCPQAAGLWGRLAV